MRHDPIHLAEFYRGLAGYRTCRHLPGMRDYYRNALRRTINLMRADALRAARHEGHAPTHRLPWWEAEGRAA